MIFDDELLAKANASGTWADFSDDDVITKSAERMNLMKASGKKDLSKLVPVQKQITRNGKQVTQTVWVKPGSDEAKAEKKPAQQKETKERKSNDGAKNEHYPPELVVLENFAEKAKKTKGFDKAPAESKAILSAGEKVINEFKNGSATTLNEAFNNIIPDLSDMEAALISGGGKVEKVSETGRIPLDKMIKNADHENVREQLSEAGVSDRAGFAIRDNISDVAKFLSSFSDGGDSGYGIDRNILQALSYGSSFKKELVKLNKQGQSFDLNERYAARAKK